MSIEDKIKLEYFKIKETFSGSASVEQPANPLKAVQGLLASKKEEDNFDLLEQIIQKVNDQNESQFEPSDRVVLDDALNALRKDKKLKNAAKRNDLNLFKNTIFQSKFQDVVMQKFEERNEAYNRFMSDEEKFNAFSAIVAEVLYHEYVEDEK